MNRIDSTELDLMVDWMLRRGEKPFPVKPGDTLTFNADNMSPDGRTMARHALDAWAEVSGLRFEHTDDYDNAQIRFHEFPEDDLPDNPGLAKGADIYIRPDIVLTKEGQPDDPAFTIFLHEIGHALGIANPENNDRDYLINSLQTSAISGRTQPQNNHNTDEHVTRTTPQTPQVADILAVHKLYGAPGPVNPGDTVYGVNTNLDSHLGRVLTTMTSDSPDRLPVTFTILDNGGEDTIDFSSDRGDQRVNLNPEWASDVYISRGNMVIARDTIIEHYIAGSSNDLVIGNDADNILEGRDGNDTLEGGPGADTLNGGPGKDTASYESSPAGVLARLHDARAVKSGDAEGDTLIDIENLTGSAHNDILAGDAEDNTLKGGDGDDVLYGGPADGKGDDRVFGGNHDYLYGGNGDDRLFGGQGNDRLYGGEGNDVLRGGPGEDALYADGHAMDVLHGGPGYDDFVFYPSDLGGGTIQDFTDGEDRINLLKFTGINAMEDLDITPLGDNVHIELAGEDYLTLIILSDFDISNLDDSDFIFVS